MATTPSDTVRALMKTFDALDLAGMQALLTDDVQGIDELSQKWMRGRDAVAAYFGQLQSMGIKDVSSSISDLHETITGDAAWVTSMVDQRYTMGPDKVHVVAPLTVALRRVGGDWKAAMINAVPLVQEPG